MTPEGRYLAEEAARRLYADLCVTIAARSGTIEIWYTDADSPELPVMLAEAVLVPLLAPSREDY